MSKGQALLIILLIMAVALTIGLSVVSRSITDIRISQQTEEAARAYSAAEAGIEEALISAGTSFSGSFETGASYQTAVAGFGAGTEFVFPQELTTDEIQTVYLATYDNGALVAPYYSGGSLDLCWDGNAAIEAILYYNSSGYKAARFAVDPDGSRAASNNFDSPDSGSCAGFTHKKTLTFPAGTKLLLRLRALYENTKVGVKAAVGANFPSQGNEIESTGTAGQATRKVKIVRFHPAPPEIFDFALYSGTNLSK